jgi:hypothetical protein
VAAAVVDGRSFWWQSIMTKVFFPFLSMSNWSRLFHARWRQARVLEAANAVKGDTRGSRNVSRAIELGFPSVSFSLFVGLRR